MEEELRNIVEILGEIENSRQDNTNKRHEFIDIPAIAEYWLPIIVQLSWYRWWFLGRFMLEWVSS